MDSIRWTKISVIDCCYFETNQPVPDGGIQILGQDITSTIRDNIISSVYEGDGNVLIYLEDARDTLIEGNQFSSCTSNKVTGYCYPQPKTTAISAAEGGVEGITLIGNRYSPWISREIDFKESDLKELTRVEQGFIKASVGSGSPLVSDCDSSEEFGRMRVDGSTGDLWICVASGWISK